MIKLMNNQSVFTSPTYNHTNSNGGTSYTLNHNFGSEPDLIEAQALVTGIWVTVNRFYWTTGGQYGSLNDTASTINASVVRLFNVTLSVDGSPALVESPSVRFICFKLGTTQTITNITPAFQWSTLEQVYPFEKASNGDTLYCKEISLGTMPNTGTKTVAHGLATSAAKTKRILGWATNGTATLPLCFYYAYSLGISVEIQAANISIRTDMDWSAYSGVLQVIYAK